MTVLCSVMGSHQPCACGTLPGGTMNSVVLDLDPGTPSRGILRGVSHRDVHQGLILSIGTKMCCHIPIGCCFQHPIIQQLTSLAKDVHSLQQPQNELDQTNPCQTTTCPVRKQDRRSLRISWVESSLQRGWGEAENCQS